MEDETQPLDERMNAARVRATAELAELAKVDVNLLSPRMLVRKAILLQLDDDPAGMPEHIEEMLLLALKRDDRYLDAYIELARYYYSVLDDRERARQCYMQALDLLQDVNGEVINGLLECDLEENVITDIENVRNGYLRMAFRKVRRN